MDRRQFSLGLTAAGILGNTAARAAAPAAAPVTPSAGSILLAQSAAFTGPAGALGSGMRDGAMAYFQRVNSEGGVQGKSIEMISADDGYEPERTKANTAKFLERSNLVALFGYVGTPTAQVAIPLASERKVPFFGAFTGASLLRQPFNPYVFNVRASYDDETEKMVELLATMGHSNIGVFHQNDSFGAAGLSGVQAALERRKLKVVAIGKVERNSVDVAAAVAALGKSSVSAIVMVSAYGSSSAFVKEMRKRGNQHVFSSVSFVGSAALRDALGKDGPGVQIAQVVPSPWDMRFPIVREYQRDVKKSGMLEAMFDFVSLEGYITARILVDGLRKVNGPMTSAALMQSLERLQFDSDGFNVSFSPTSHNGSKFVEMTAIGPDGKFLR
jgi:branched-chain amino acid transport system substrate-binding protein